MYEDFTRASCRDFVAVLASSQPVPGGGGAAALVGAIGTALGNMVGSLTVGKAKYAAVQTRIEALQRDCDELQNRLLDQVAEDARGFAPLAEAYGIPKDDPSRPAVLEQAGVRACGAPLQIMRLSCQAIEILAELAEIGSRLAVSDAGCGAVCCKAALQAAALNVWINTRSLCDRAVAEQLDAECAELLARGCRTADAVYARVQADLRRAAQ